MQTIKNTTLLDLIDAEISKLPNYESTIKIEKVSANFFAGSLTYISNINATDERIFLVREYIEQIDHIFQGKYNRLF